MLAPLTGQFNHHAHQGEQCDKHPDRPSSHARVAVTDSMGDEYEQMCEECYDNLKKARNYREENLDYDTASSKLIIYTTMLRRASWSDEYQRVFLDTSYRSHPDEEMFILSTQSTDQDQYHPTDEDKAAKDWIALSLRDYNHGQCDCCKKFAHRRIEHRDMDEGSHGPVYEYCNACNNRRNTRLREEQALYDEEDN